MVSQFVNIKMTFSYTKVDTDFKEENKSLSKINLPLIGDATQQNVGLKQQEM
jgi:hypothetical protein